MAFVYEDHLPESDFWRFDSLQPWRRDFIVGANKKSRLSHEWAIDRERDVFFVSGFRRDPDGDRTAERFNPPSYFMLCEKGVFYGLEIKCDFDSIIITDKNASAEGYTIKARIFNYLDGLLYIPLVHFGRADAIESLLREAIEQLHTQWVNRGLVNHPEYFTPDFELKISVEIKERRAVSPEDWERLLLW